MLGVGVFGEEGGGDRQGEVLAFGEDAGRLVDHDLVGVGAVGVGSGARVRRDARMVMATSWANAPATSRSVAAIGPGWAVNRSHAPIVVSWWRNGRAKTEAMRCWVAAGVNSGQRVLWARLSERTRSPVRQQSAPGPCLPEIADHSRVRAARSEAAATPERSVVVDQQHGGRVYRQSLHAVVDQACG